MKDKSAKVTLNEVAKLSNVSHTTVSNVLNNTGSVSEKTRQRVLAAIETLNYEHNVLARSLKTRKSQVLGVVISDNCNPLFSLVVKGIEEVATQRGYNVILCNTNQEIDTEIKQIKTLYERQVDGIVISLATESVNHLDKYIHRKPFVFINRSPDQPFGDIVLTDNFKGGYDAVSHLLSLGHRRIGIFGCSPQYITGRERLRGYHTALEQYQVPVDPALIVKRRFRIANEAYQVAKDFIKEAKPTAVFGATYYSMLGILKAIHFHRLRIPEDISIAGFDDCEWSECFNPPLTTVAQPGEEMGRRAASILINRLEGDDHSPYTKVCLAPTLKIRASSRSYQNSPL